MLLMWCVSSFSHVCTPFSLYLSLSLSFGLSLSLSHSYKFHSGQNSFFALKGSLSASSLYFTYERTRFILSSGRNSNAQYSERQYSPIASQVPKFVLSRQSICSKYQMISNISRKHSLRFS